MVEKVIKKVGVCLFVRAMKEKNIQTDFTKKNKVKGFFELKLEKGKSFAFSKVAEHQVEALLLAETKGLKHKIQDAPIFSGMKTRFNIKKPCDCFFLDAPAYVVICFYIPRKEKVCYYLPIKRFIALKDKYERFLNRKSMKKEEVKENAQWTLNLMK